MGNGANSNVSWLFPAMIGALVALIGTCTTYHLTNQKNTQEQTLNVTKERAKIIESVIVNEKNLTAARLRLTYVLKPIDKTGKFEEFEKNIMKLLNESALHASVELVSDSLSIATSNNSEEIRNLIEKLAGSDSECLSASNALVTHAKTDQVAVVDALVDSLKKEERYRANLYVVFTLAQIPGGWHGTEDQLAEVTSLRETKKYVDKTFEKRTEEAISNWRKRNVDYNLLRP